MPWKGRYEDSSAEDAQAYAMDFKYRHELTNKQMATLLGTTNNTIASMLTQPGRRPSKLMVSVMRHLDGDESLDELLIAARKKE